MCFPIPFTVLADRAEQPAGLEGARDRADVRRENDRLLREEAVPNKQEEDRLPDALQGLGRWSTLTK